MSTSIICIFVLPFYIGFIIASPVVILASPHQINANGKNVSAARICNQHVTILHVLRYWNKMCMYGLDNWACWIHADTLMCVVFCFKQNYGNRYCIKARSYKATETIKSANLKSQCSLQKVEAFTFLVGVLTSLFSGFLSQLCLNGRSGRGQFYVFSWAFHLNDTVTMAKLDDGVSDATSKF